MKDIGSIFPLYDYHIEKSKKPFCLSPRYKEQILYSLCREALYVIAENYMNCNKRVLLPSYTCQTVIDPFIQLGWDISFYPIEKDLKINKKSLLDISYNIKPDIIVAHPFYGMDLDEEEQETINTIKDKGSIIIIDNTQCIFSELRLPFVDYYVGSYRKWFCCPDGAFLEDCKNNIRNKGVLRDNNEVFVQLQTDAMYLRGKYFETSNEYIKQISIRLYKQAIKVISKNITPHGISNFAKAMMAMENIPLNKSKRMENYNRLFHSLKNNNSLSLVCNVLSRITTAPLYFPIYVKERQKIQKQLAEQHIYAPILWPVYSQKNKINATTTFIYDNILAIPCDQRYDEKDMERIINIINN